jgi:hypothetical protein
MNEKELLKRIAELPREMEPGRDPWDRIAARLDESAGGSDSALASQRSRLWGWPVRAVAALAVLAVVVTLLNHSEMTIEPPVMSQTEGTANLPMSLQVVLAGSEAEYQAAFREFVPIGDSRDRISPMTVEKIETGWADLRHVENALADALSQNPDDAFLNRRMLELRSRQLGFLRQLAALDQSNRRMTI